MNIARKISNALILASLLAGSMAVVNNTPAQAKTCAIGYAKNSAGVCVDVTKQRPAVSKASKKAAAHALCLGMSGWTPAKHKTCMANKGYK